MNTTISFSTNLILPLVTFTISLIVSYFCLPIIIKVSNLKNLMAEPNNRDVHSTKTPNLGGVAIFVAIFLMIPFLGNYFETTQLLNLSGSMLIMFFIGLVDDLIGMRPKSKLIGQILVALSITLLTNLRIENLFGILGIYELPYVISVFTTVLVYVTIINAYNLIDGVDGLAGSFAITANLIFGCIFYMNGNYFLSALSMALIGALVSFLIFNFSKTKKIFMGDTGSMLIGFLLAYQAINFMTVGFNENFTMIDSKSVIYFLALFSFPLVDTIRVFFIRIKAGKSPFSADNNHIHHNLLAYGLKHWEISLISSMYTLFLVTGVFLFNGLETNQLVLVLVSMWFVSGILIDNLSLFFMPVNLKITPNILKENNIEDALISKKGKVIYLNKSA